MKVSTFPEAINATKFIENKMSGFLSQDLSDTIINLRKFLCEFGGMIGVQNESEKQIKIPDKHHIVEHTKSEYKFSWSEYLKNDFKKNGPSKIKDIFDRFNETQGEAIKRLGINHCKSQLRAGAFHLKRNEFLTKNETGRNVVWTPTKKLIDS